MSRGRARLAIADGFAVWVLEAPQGFGDAGFQRRPPLQADLHLHRLQVR